MEKKRCKVVMLPTDKAENCIIKRQNGISSSLHYQKTLLTQDYLKNGDGVIGFPKTSHHLYFVNDEDIATGDWVLFSDVVMIAKSFDDRVVHDGKGNSFMKGDCHKVIATTDPELRSDGLIEDPNNPKDNLLIRKGLPQPSQAFIEEYCRKGGIDEVDVEYGKYHNGNFINDGKTHAFTALLRPEVSNDNTINIHPIKDTCTRDEVINKLKEYWNETHGEGANNQRLVDWIKENL